VIPLLACLPAIGGALMRGQVDMILLLLFCGMLAAALRGQSLRAGCWLGASISIKVIPVFLLLYPIFKRDVRWLAGSAATLVLCLGIVPAAAFGPQQTLTYYREWHARIARPGLSSKGDQTRAGELTRVFVTDSQSFMAMIHHPLHGRGSRDAITPMERRAHWSIGAALTLATLVLGLRSVRRPQSPSTIVFLGSLIVLMAMTSPVCHLHYFSLCVPLTMGLMAASWERYGKAPKLTMGLWLLLAFNVVGNAVPRLPGFGWSRDFCLASYATLALWAVGGVILWSYARLPSLPSALDSAPPRKLAA
jgi:hypothetical protein